MGWAKEAFFEMEAERERKYDALLEAPKLIERSNRRIDSLRDDVDRNSEAIDDLRQQVAAAHSWKSKWSDYFIGGVVGAIIASFIGWFL